MAKDPAFLFYTGDFTTGTQFFSDEQVGKYIRLLMAQHQLGHLEEKHMIKICKTYDKDVFSKFVKDSDGLYFNQRLENEVIRRKEYSLSRAKNRSTKNNICNSYDEHMENENINSINNIVKNSKNGEKNKPINFRAQSEELFLRRISEGESKVKRNRDKDNQIET